MAPPNPGSQTNELDTNKTYKDQLDETAHKIKYGDPANENGGGVVRQATEKVSQYVPAVGKVLGTGATEKNEDGTSYSLPGPPDRPHHDTQIEEFVRDQHRSKTEEGTLTGEQ